MKVTINIETIRRCVYRRPIVLVGLMGAGKSSVGRRLAAALNVSFSDADQEIEKAAGKSIVEIFEDDGEDFFRDGERRVISRLLREGGRILATGGGAFINQETRRHIDEVGISVWLKADLDILMSRLGRRDTRPLLKTSDPRAVMERLIAERYPVYALADIVIDSRDVPHEVIVQEIIEAVGCCAKCSISEPGQKYFP